MAKSFEWLLFLELADRLILIETEECYRSAVSRSYYGVFGNIRSELEKAGIIFKRANLHQQIIDWLISQQLPDLESIGKKLYVLRNERNHADYDSKELFNRFRAENSLAIARSIADSIKKSKLV